MEPRDAAMHFEAVKVSMRQDKTGTMLVLSIHPDQVPVDLFSSRLGTRFVVALVEVDDHDQPVKGKVATEGELAMKSAAMLCRNPRFQNWLHNNGMSLGADELHTAIGLRDYCEIESRSELADSHVARIKFDRLKERFEKSLWDEKDQQNEQF